MIKKPIKFSLLSLGIGLLALSSCKKDDDLVPVPPPTQNEGELITTITIDFVDAAGVQPAVSATFRDSDGPGGNDPETFDEIILAPNTTYNATITLLNESESPAEDITVEVLAEDDEHLFCFTVMGIDLAITRTDSDGTFEVGLSSSWTTGATTGQGTTTVVLKHQPGTKDGSCEPGETDIEVTFVTKIQ